MASAYCPYCCKPIEWEVNTAGIPVAVDPGVFLFRRVSDDQKGIKVITALGEIMRGVTVKNPANAYDYGMRVHWCYAIGRLRL